MSCNNVHKAEIIPYLNKSVHGGIKTDKNSILRVANLLPAVLFYLYYVSL